jgi:hypothetical protein
MKKLLLVAVVLLFAAAAFGAENDHDTLIAPDGTVFNITGEPSEDGYTSSLGLTVQSGGKSSYSLVPDSIDGLNSHPVLAYDADSKTLFLFWQRVNNDASSDLLIASYQKDAWEPATIIDSKRVARFSLNVGITRSVRQKDRDGNVDTVPALVLHVAWWEEGGASGQGAHYAVMGLRGGAVVDPDVHDMSEFQRDDASDAKINQNFLRQVAILSGPTPDAVDVLYADPHSKSFYRTTLRPIVEGRLHIPVGARPGKLGGPHALDVDWSGRSGAISSPDGNTVIFYNVGVENVTYLQVSDSKWSDPLHVALSAKVTADAVVNALNKMVAATTAAAK